MTTSRTRKSTSSSTTKKSSATKKSSPAKKSTSVKKSTPRKSAAKKSAPRAEPRPQPKAAQIAVGAAEQLGELTGKQVEGVTGISKSESGWTVSVEVLEVSRIPNTTDVLALYEVTLDDAGSLEGYRRLGRYARGVSRED